MHTRSFSVEHVLEFGICLQRFDHVLGRGPRDVIFTNQTGPVKKVRTSNRVDKEQSS